MKMVKSLLLGSAAGVVAMAGAQAADLPVKAKPVQYVKICSLYGAGFYYIPGTDMCLKVGGWVRAEYGYGDNGNLAWGWANANVNDRSTHNSTFRARGYITADARNQTEYGTVRSYIAVGVSDSNVGLNSASNTFSANRAFVQFAGFTFGVAQSFFDFYSVPATALWGAYPASDTGDPGWMVMGYTAQFGNGLSASIAAEQRRFTAIYRGSISASSTGVSATNQYGGFQTPDLVANLRVDQKWGSAQIMGALHQVNSLYYGSGGSTGHPDEEVGFAVGVGGKIFTPTIGMGDYLQFQVNYSQGANRYVFMTPSTNWFKNDGTQFGFGALSDGVYGGTLAGTGTSAATSVELTTAWGVNAAYEHYWNKSWKTSVYGGYAEVSYNDTANSLLCRGDTAPVTNGCDNDWQTWWVGSRTQWNLSSDLYMAVDILYAKLNTATFNSSSTTYQDQDQVMARFRVHKDFYP
jgi:hypothetical protein